MSYKQDILEYFNDDKWDESTVVIHGKNNITNGATNRLYELTILSELIKIIKLWHGKYCDYKIKTHSISISISSHDMARVYFNVSLNDIKNYRTRELRKLKLNKIIKNEK